MFSLNEPDNEDTTDTKSKEESYQQDLDAIADEIDEAEFEEGVIN